MSLPKLQILIMSPLKTHTYTKCVQYYCIMYPPPKNNGEQDFHADRTFTVCTYGCNIINMYARLNAYTPKERSSVISAYVSVDINIITLTVQH